MTRVAIIGAGPGGLMTAEKLAERGFDVTVYDQRPSAARKFLMAGRGGLNITHSEPFEIFLTRYGEAAPFLRPALEFFTPQDLRDWCHQLGEETFIGTSGRVFPKSFKASPLLRAWLARLQQLGVKFQFQFQWTGQAMDADIVVLALGGASWPRLGSDGQWTEIIQSHGIQIAPLRSANCGFETNWSDFFKNKFSGTPLKPVLLSHGKQSMQGEIMITSKGVEGGGIYALSKSLRHQIEQEGKTTLLLDLKPNSSIKQIEQNLANPRGHDSFSNFLRKSLNLSPVAIGLIQEDRQASHLSPTELAGRIKSLPLMLTKTFPIDRAISSAGGICLDELNENFMLKKWPQTYAIGEMLDWEAPTGGYLLQATFSMAAWLGSRL